MAGGLEQGSRGQGRVSKGLGGWGLERAEGLGSGGVAGLDPQGTSGRSPLCSIGYRPLRVRCPKSDDEDDAIPR